MAKAWDVLGYTYSADHHCVACTIAARDAGKLTCAGTGYNSNEPGEDMHGLAYALCDGEGNSIHPIFASDEPPLREDGTCAGCYCGDCGAVIVEPDPEEDDGGDDPEPDGFAEFFAGYVTCALWSSTDDEGNPLDDNFGAEDIGDDTDKAMREDCADFMRANAADLAAMMEATGRDMSSMGHDFWLTRNGHGAGFWDRGAGDVGDRLTDACKPYGGVDLYIGDDGKVHG